MPKKHELKILEDFADAVFYGDKTFEIRKNDRAFQKGDFIQFTAVTKVPLYLDKIEHPINREVYLITYVLSGFHIDPDYVVLGIRPLGDREEEEE